MFYESLAATTDMAVLPGVLGCRLLRCTFQVRLGTKTLRLPGGTPIFAVSRQQFMEFSKSETVLQFDDETFSTVKVGLRSAMGQCPVGQFAVFEFDH
jgi:hypothetical protein